MSKKEHDDFVKLIQNIIEKLKPQINRHEFEYINQTKRGSISDNIDLLVQFKDTIIIFECKLNKNYTGRSDQLDKHFKHLNLLKNKLTRSKKLYDFNKIIRIYAIRDQNYLINIDTGFSTDIDPSFKNNPKIIY